jgi:hypothetical protein
MLIGTKRLGLNDNVDGIIFKKFNKNTDQISGMSYLPEKRHGLNPR